MWAEFQAGKSDQKDTDRQTLVIVEYISLNIPSVKGTEKSTPEISAPNVG